MKNCHRYAWLFALCGVLLIGMVGDVQAREPKTNRRIGRSHHQRSTRAARSEAPRSRSRARERDRRKAQRERDACRKAKGKAKRRCGGRKEHKFAGRSVKPDSLRTEAVPRPSGNVWLYAINFREEIQVNIYDDGGAIDEEALAQLDNGFRCKRTGEQRAVDPRLYETLSAIYDHFGQQRIELVSGFRFQKNEGSRHYHAAAMDIRIPGVSIRELYDFAESLDTGGMGIGLYPRSDFVHIDWRAPGAGSYRWTDYSPPDGSAPDKQPSRAWKRKPSS